MCAHCAPCAGFYVGTGTIKGGGGVIKSSKCLQVGRYRYYYRYKDYYSNKELFYFVLLLILLVIVVELNNILNRRLLITTRIKRILRGLRMFVYLFFIKFITTCINIKYFVH